MKDSSWWKPQPQAKRERGGNSNREQLAGILAFEIGPSRGLALESAAVLILTWVGLRSLGFRRWQKLLSLLTPAAPGTVEIQPTLLDRCRATARVGWVRGAPPSFSI